MTTTQSPARTRTTSPPEPPRRGLAARVSLGLPPWVGDRRHLTHIAQNAGVPRIAIAPLFATAAFCCAALA